jgi:hypothetical protein
VARAKANLSTANATRLDVHQGSTVDRPVPAAA